MKQYIAFISIDGLTFGVVFHDFPCCVFAGKNFEDAVRMAHEALSGHIECMKDAGLKISNPSSLKLIKQNGLNGKTGKTANTQPLLLPLFPVMKLGNIQSPWILPWWPG